MPASPIAPMPARPTVRLATRSVPWMKIRLLMPRPNSGHEKLAYSRSVPRSKRSRIG